jgi:hypothetical protein
MTENKLWMVITLWGALHFYLMFIAFPLFVLSTLCEIIWVLWAVAKVEWA